MSNNKVFQVLPTKGNKAILAAGGAVSALTEGQIGIFDAETNLAVDATSLASTKPKKVFIAVGLADSKVAFSAGQDINVDQVESVSLKNYVAGAANVFDISNFVAENDTEYALKLEIRNMEVYTRQGAVQYTETFNIVTVADTDIDATRDAIKKLVDELNLQVSGLFTAKAVLNSQVLTISAEPTADGDATVTVDGTAITVALLNADDIAGVCTKIAAAINASTVDAYAVAGATTVTVTLNIGKTFTYTVGSTGATGTVAAAAATEVATANIMTLSEGLVPNIRITANTMAVNSYFGINPKYYYPRNTLVLPSFVAGFNGLQTVTEVTAAVVEQGNVYDIRQQMYKAGGWNGRPGPYRTSTHLGFPYEGVYEAGFNTVNGAHYMQIPIVYDTVHSVGPVNTLSNLCTTIAIPTADSTTSGGVVAAINALLGSALVDPNA